ncbi:MAG: hypothetical protein ACTSYC_02885 [Promethearchaeota archaeon]
MIWQEKFEEIFFPYLSKIAKIEKGNKFRKETLDNFLKKILRYDYSTETLLTIYFLIDEKVQRFIRKYLRLILNSLTIYSVDAYNTSKGFVKGKLIMNATIQQFRLKEYKPTFYKCREIYRNYNTPENRLLKYLLFSIKSLFLKLPKHLSITSKKGSSRQESRAVENMENLLSTLSELKRLFFKHVHNIKLKSIELPKYIDNTMIERLLKARNPLYRKVYEIYNIYDTLFNSSELDEKLVRKLIDFKRIIPADLNKQFEIFILFLTLKSFDDCSSRFNLNKLGLILPRQDAIATYEYQNGPIIHIYYDRHPESEIYKKRSIYRKIIYDYFLEYRIRRPDIIIEIINESQAKKAYFFIEIKNTKKKKYLLSSIYKSFAYLYDFSQLFPKEQNPKLFLITDHSNKIYKNFDVEVRLKREKSLKIFSWRHIHDNTNIISESVERIINSL